MGVELAVVVPVIVLLLGAAVAGGRMYLARAVVADAAAGAARSATLARTAGEAGAAADQAAQSALVTGGLTCVGRSVTVDTAAFATAPGVPATVTSRVSCTVDLGDVLVPGLPGSMTLSADGHSALDTYRGRR